MKIMVAWYVILKNR
jgi:hypothetical protein